MKPSFYAKYGLLLLMAAIFLQPLVMLGSRWALDHHRNHLEEWVSPGLTEAAEYAWFQRQFPQANTLVVSWDGCTLDDTRLEAFVTRLAPAACGLEVQAVQNRLHVLSVRPNSTAAKAGILPGDVLTRIGHQSLQSAAQLRQGLHLYGKGDPISLTVERAGQATELVITAETSAPAGNAYFEQVVSGANVLNLLAGNGDPAAARQKLTGTWLGQDLRPRNLDGSPVNPKASPQYPSCAIVTLSAAGVTDPQAAFSALEAAAQASAIPRATLRVGGPLAENIALDREGTRRLNAYSIIGGVIGLALSLYFFRNRRLALLVFIGAAYSAGLSLSIVSLTGQSVDALLLTMPAIIYTTALSASLHLVNYYRRTVLDEGSAGAVERAVRQAFFPCLLSATGTAIALLSLTMNELLPIVKFGFFTGLGVVTALGLLFSYLPSALTLLQPERVDGAGDSAPESLFARRAKRLRPIAEGIVRSRLRLAAFGVVVIVGGAVMLSQSQTSVGLLALFSPQSELLQSYHWLEEKLGPQTPIEIIVRFDAPAVTADQEKLTGERLALIRRVEDAVRALDDSQGILSAATFTTVTPGRNETALAGLSGRYRVTGEHEDLWRIEVRVSALQAVSLARKTRELQGAVEPVIAAGRSDKLTGLRGVVLTGLAPLAETAQQHLLTSLIENLAWAAAILGVVMALIYSSVAAGLTLTLSILAPVTIVYGALSALSIRLDIGAMMTAMVAVSVSIDNSLHFTHWFRRGTAHGMHRHDAVVYAYLNAAGPILQRSVMVGLGMALYGLSSFVPTQRFGLLINALLAVGLLMDLVLTPAILAGPLAAFFTRRHAMTRKSDVDRHLLNQSGGAIPPGGHTIPAPHVPQIKISQPQ